MKRGFLFSLFSLQIFFASSQTDQSATYVAGYKNIVVADSSRIYKPNSAITNPLHYRPLEIDLWYPASPQNTNSTLKYIDFISLLQDRSNRFQDDSVYKNITSELLQYLSINLEVDTGKLANLKTNSYKDAAPVEKQFPLIIYQCAYNGMSYENIPLFESLVSNGFIVACITSVGRYPGNMTTNYKDVMEQVNDGIFAIHYLKTNNNIDSNKIGTIGYSWGGLVSAIMAMNNKDIKAVLSLDGSEMFYYRKDDDEDSDFNQLRATSFFHPENIQAQYAYFESGLKQDEEPADSIYNILSQLKDKKNYVHFFKAAHEDFSVIPSLAINSKEEIKHSGFYDTIITSALNFFNQYLNDKNDLFIKTTKNIFQKNNADSIYPIALAGKETAPLLKGKIIDAKTKLSLAYVNVGILKKNIGTVSQTDGSFKIPATTDDSIEVSMIGYASQVCLPGKLKTHSNIVIEMMPKENALPEVVITSKTLPVQTLGNTTTSKFMSIGLPLKFLGSEIGIKIKAGKRPALLKSFNFNVSDNRLDSATFRLNIYSIKKGQPFENILSKEILIHVGNQAGLYHIKLDDYKIILKEDVIISLEWIDGGKSGNERGVLFLSAAMFNSGTWHRKTSLGNWTKAKGLGVGFNVNVQPLLSKKD